MKETNKLPVPGDLAIFVGANLPGVKINHGNLGKIVKVLAFVTPQTKEEIEVARFGQIIAIQALGNVFGGRLGARREQTYPAGAKMLALQLTFRKLEPPGEEDDLFVTEPLGDEVADATKHFALAGQL